MPQNQALGIHFYFNPGVPSTKPTSWNKCGVVGTLALKPQRETIEQEGPAPGCMARLDVIEVSRKMDFTVKVKQTEPLFWQLLLQTLPLAPGANVQFNPSEGGLVKGWAKFQAYDQNEVPTLNIELWCAIDIASPPTLGDKQLVTYEVEGKVIRNPLNVGSLQNLV